MKVTSSRHAYSIFKKHLTREVEEFWVMALNSQLEIIQMEMLFRGTVHSCPFHPRDLIRFLCLSNCSGFVIAHNHPSGNSRPSKEDRFITKKIHALAQLVDIKMNDHLILGKDCYFSFADALLLKKFDQQICKVTLNRFKSSGNY
ncbi:MAG: DNA repair protein [Bdellovibrio sp. CG10_big_fil_rev_8_21_14_0_10_47_8]|nr:MAG: DNA repair protein [Bdellovibrio sp. CG10_big_fil_rev_8_21_14_0_10_47_8]